MWQAMPRDSHGSLALLVEGIPQAPFERRISFCGCAFCERFLAAPLVSSAVFRNSNIKCHRKSAFVRMRACLCVSFASIKAPLCMESVIRQKLTKHRENRSSYIEDLLFWFRISGCLQPGTFSSRKACDPAPAPCCRFL